MWIFRPPEGHFFSDDERRQVEALFDGILPGTDTAPGAGDVGAAEYLDRLLSDESTYFEIARWRQLYRDALPAVDAAAAKQYGGRGVAELGADERKELLTQLSSRAVDGVPTGFFGVLRSHCIEGCFSDPRWGGNRDALMWRWYGYLQKPEVFRR